jgi:hypothetical protein
MKKAETEDNGEGKSRKSGLKFVDQIWDITIHKYNLFNKVEAERAPILTRIFTSEEYLIGRENKSK